MAGRIVESVLLRRADLRIPFPERLKERLEGRRIARLGRRAKYLLVHVEGVGEQEEDVLVIHLGMSGQMHVVADMKGYVPQKHDHMLIRLSGGGGVVLNDARRFGMVMLYAAAAYEGQPAFREMGPEPLGNAFSGYVLRERLRGKSVPVKQALLDQRVVAGVGNIYASEALYEAGISPLAKAGGLSAAKADALVQSIRNVLTRAIESGGSSLKDFIKVDGTLGYFQHSFAVYDREGAACPRCAANGKKKAVILKINQAGRATYYCRQCQK